jgi:hypothetical protein
MSRTRRMPMKTLIAALGATVALAPSAAARVPDVVPLSGSTTQQSQDLRSPDARDAASQPSRWQAYDDAVRHLTPAQQAVVFGSTKPAAPTSRPSGDDHIDAPIAAGGVVAVLLGIGGLVFVGRRRNAVQGSSAPAVSS